MRRHLLGIIGIALLAGGLIWYICDPANRNSVWLGALLRVGPVLCVLWMALPQLQKSSIWMYAMLIGCVVLIARSPKLAMIILPAALVMWFLKPRGAGSGKMNKSSSSRSK